MPSHQPKHHAVERFFKRLQVNISTGDITILQSGGIRARAPVLLHRQQLNDGDISNEELLAMQLQLALKAAHCQGMAASIALTDTLLRSWMVTPPSNAATLSDCKAAAALRFHGLFGEFSADWEIAADWDAEKPFLASALPRSLLQRLTLICAEFKLTLLKLESHFVMSWNQFRKDLGKDAWMATLADDCLTVAVVGAGRLIALRSVTLAGDSFHSKSWLVQHLQREALLLNLSPPKKMQIHGVIPAPWLKHEADQLQCQPLGMMTSFAQPEMVQKGAA